MKILVFGAGGYLGIPVCETLAARGHVLVAADRWFFGKAPTAVLAMICKLDIRSVEPKHLSFGKGPFDAVIDLAGLSNDLTAEIDPDLTRSINIDGGKRLATLAKQAGICRYVYSSSASVYGAGAKPNLTETDECKPLTLYARSKVEVEDHLRRLSGGGFEPVILRNATVFGVAPRMRFDLAVNVMTLRAHRDGVIFVMGGGEQWRPFIHVSDAVCAFVWAVEQADGVAGETFNVGTSNHAIGEIAEKVNAVIPTARITPIPDDPDKRSYSCEFGRINRARALCQNTVTVDAEIAHMAKMLRDGTLKDDPSCYTLQYYRSLIEWDRRLSNIRLDGRIL